MTLSHSGAQPVLNVLADRKLKVLSLQLLTDTAGKGPVLCLPCWRLISVCSRCKKWIVILTKLSYLSCMTPLIIPCLPVQCSSKSLSCSQFGMWEIQWVHCVLNDATSKIPPVNLKLLLSNAASSRASTFGEGFLILLAIQLS